MAKIIPLGGLTVEALEWVQEKMGTEKLSEEEIEFIEGYLRLDKENKIALGGMLEFFKWMTLLGVFLSVVTFLMSSNVIRYLGASSEIVAYIVISVINISAAFFTLVAIISRKKKMRYFLIALPLIAVILNVSFLIFGLVEFDFRIVFSFAIGMYYLFSKRVKFTFLN